ncbi:MAG: hypothetical protein QW734_02580 [Candidatus Bathyarchaeia archaeon]
MLLLVVNEMEVYGPSYVTKVVAINASNMEVIHKFSAPSAICDRMWSSFAISPDETRIFFANSGRDSVEIVSANLDGSSQTIIKRISIVQDQLYETIIDVARDGMFLVYTERGSFYDYENYRTVSFSRIKKFDFNTNETSLVLEFEGCITSLKIAPSNDKIAFTANKNPFVSSSENSYDGLYIVNLDGTNATRVPAVADANVALWVNWVSNETLTYTEVSNKILTSGNEYEWAPTANITAVNVDGSNKRIICKGFCGSPSPVDDGLVAFLQFSDAEGLKFIPYLLNRNLPITPNPDSDGDGLPDMDELRNCLNPCNPTDVHKDYDNDGLTNLEEINYKTYMFNPDSDDDGLGDGVEVKIFLTDPMNWDTDGDHISDGIEASWTGLNALVNVLPAGWIRMQLEWRNKRMYVSTNSSVLGVVFNSTSMALTVNVGGPDGTAGVANITVPIDMISSLSTVTVTLDNQPLDFQISQAGGYAQIYVQYHHSFHQLTAHLSGGGGGIGGVNLTGILGYWWLILSIAIVAVASVIAAIIVKRG